MTRRILRFDDVSKAMTPGKDLEGNVIEIPLDILTHQQVGLAADSTGVKYTSPYYILIPAAFLKWASEVYLEAEIEASNTDSVTAVEFYSETAAAVRGSVSANASVRARSDDFLANLVAGEEHSIRINVTTASATTGATTSVRRVALILVISVE